MTCPICDDDGWVDIPDEETGGVLGAQECPRLHDPGHAPFNASGLLSDATASAPKRSSERRPGAPASAPLEQKQK